jgi:hypothetical protein
MVPIWRSRGTLERVVDGVAPGEANYLVRDTDVKGFVLVVTPAGAKSYAIDYRAGSGRVSPKRRLTIGKHGSPWTPEMARIEAKRLLAEAAAGRDPATARQKEREALTFSELIDLYLAEGVSHKKDPTLKADRGRINHHLRPLLGKLRSDRIGRAEIECMRDAIAAGKDGSEDRGRREAKPRQHRGWGQRRGRAVRLARRLHLWLRDRSRACER